MRFFHWGDSLYLDWMKKTFRTFSFDFPDSQFLFPRSASFSFFWLSVSWSSTAANFHWWPLLFLFFLILLQFWEILSEEHSPIFSPLDLPKDSLLWSFILIFFSWVNKCNVRELINIIDKINKFSAIHCS